RLDGKSSADRRAGCVGSAGWLADFEFAGFPRPENAVRRNGRTGPGGRIIYVEPSFDQRVAKRVARITRPFRVAASPEIPGVMIVREQGRCLLRPGLCLRQRRRVEK